MLAVAIHFLLAADGRPSPSRNTGGSYISPGHCTTGLDVPELVPVVCQLFEAGLAVSSLKSYTSRGSVGTRRSVQRSPYVLIRLRKLCCANLWHDWPGEWNS